MKLSIVTISYQDAQGLERTLRSLEPLRDSEIDWEHVVVDSSPEVNERVLASLPAGWPLVRMVEKPRGIYAAMNAGIARAKGEWVWLLNGGDRLHDVGVLKQCLASGGDGSDLVCAGAAVYRGGNYRRDRLPKQDFGSSILGGRNWILHQGMLYRREALLKIGPFSENYRIAGDYEHHFRCLLAGLKAKVVLLPLAEHDLGGASDEYLRSLAECREIARAMRERLGLGRYLKLRMGLFAETYRLKAVKLLKR